MQGLSIPELITATQGECATVGTRAITAGLTTDSRAVRPGCIFLALTGERFDGNTFAAAAVEAGAAALVLSRPPAEPLDPACTLILVPDTLIALQRLAQWWRGQLEPLAVIGLTGSSGKTSTKDMCLSILSRCGKAQATRGNLNNHIGVPLSILAAEKGLQSAIWEMGMNHAGELAPLCALTRPRIGIITTIGSAHLEFLGSRDAIAEEKCTLARALPPEGCMIYPAADDYADYIASQTRAECLPVGGVDSRVRALNPRSSAEGTTYTLHIDGAGEVEVALPVPGAHMVSNSLLAAAAAWKLGCSLPDIAAGLSCGSLTKGRLSCKRTGDYIIVDDSYNANPESMRAALDTVAALPGARRAIAVLGKMGELGPQGIAAHEAIGRRAAELGYAALIVVGAECPETLALCRGAAGIPTQLVPTPQAGADALRALLQPGDALLFKGSRAAGMEKTLAALFPEL